MLFRVGCITRSRKMQYTLDYIQLFTVLYNSVLYNTVLYCTVLLCVVLFYFVLNCFVLIGCTGGRSFYKLHQSTT